MNREDLKRLLEEIRDGEISISRGLERLRDLPYEGLGFAHVDHHRSLRQGAPEVIFCQGKTDREILSIVQKMLAKKHDILATRSTKEVFRKIKKKDKRAVFHERSGTIVIEQKKRKGKGKVLVLSAGTADIPVAEEAAVTAAALGSRVETIYDVGVAGIHRLFDQKEKILAARVLVVVAGMEGALASVVGGLVDKPVIAVPTSVGYGASFGGVAALLSMLNSCASGVATVNIDNGFGGGSMAHRINILGEKG
jgi:NCAIR mutase (PurE)-related protein